MALAHVPPQPAPDDLVTLKEAVALMRETPYPVPSVETLRSWIADRSMRTWRVLGKVRVSYSDVLLAQRDEARRAGLPL